MGTEHTRRSTVEHRRVEQRKQDAWDRDQRIADTITECSRALARADECPDEEAAQYYRLIHERCRTTLAPALRKQTGDPLLGYWEGLDDRAWKRYEPLERFTDPPLGLDLTHVRAHERVQAVFHALTTIAEAEEVVEAELRSQVPVKNFTVKVGEHIQEWDMNIGNPVRGVALDTEAMKTLFCGGTGDGKSTALETEAEDYYQQNHRDGRDYKLIDLVDIDKGENWFYDIPQQQPKLRRIRGDEMDLPADFTVTEELARPKIDIRLPLTPGLASDPLPFDHDAATFRVTPFTIPASDLSKRILIPCIMSRLSDDQEQTVRQAYDDVNRRKDDWALRDLADEIAERDELSAKHKADAVGVLRSLQDLGFIRTHQSSDTLDWRAIFRDTERITLFSQAKIQTGTNAELGKYLCIAYLIDKILNLRRNMHSVPDAVLLMRELWEITPQRGRLSPDGRAAAVQEALANRMGKVMRKLRHFDLHLIADTQEPGDLHKQVREMFNRYVVFSANRDTIDDIFSWTSNDRRQAFWSTMNQEKGKAGVVGKVEPAVQERDIEFISPVAFAPPSHHHYDKARDTNGWLTRQKYLSPVDSCPECDSETLARVDGTTVACQDCDTEADDAAMGRRESLECPLDIEGVEWNDEIPPHLQIGDRRETDSDGPSVTMRPVAAFAHRCLRTVDDEEYVFKADVREAFNAFLSDHDREPWDFTKQSKQSTFGNRLRDYYPEDAYEPKLRQRDGTRNHAYVGLLLNETGRKYIER